MKNTTEPTTAPVDLNQPLIKAGILSINGEIKPHKINDTILSILAYEKLGYKELTIYINSTGGDLPSAFALVDIIKASPITFTLVGMGDICSSALIIFLSGDVRILTPNSCILSHQFSWSSDGKYHDLKSSHVEEQNTMDKMISLYVSATGLTRLVVERELLQASDVWLTPKQCLKYKIAHKIMACGKKKPKKK